MKITLNIDDSLIKKASDLMGIDERAKLVRLGLEALIIKSSSKRLGLLGGTEKYLKPVRRRRLK